MAADEWFGMLEMLRKTRERMVSGRNHDLDTTLSLSTDGSGSMDQNRWIRIDGSGQYQDERAYPLPISSHPIRDPFSSAKS